MSAPASMVRAIAAQAVTELRLTARRGENLLALVGIPVIAMVFFGLAGGAAVVDDLVPASLALAIVATGLVNLGIATAYERQYGVLKRLGGSPLGRPGLLAAKSIVVLGIAVIQVIALAAIAAAILGWRPDPVSSSFGAGVGDGVGAEVGTALLAVVAVLVVVTVGVAAFAGLGLAFAGALRPEGTLVVANTLFLAFLLLGGVVVPIERLPGPLAAIAGILPAGALAEAFRAALGAGGDLASSLFVVAVWAIAAAVVAIRTFRWD